MKNHKINLRYIAMQNLKQRPSRCICLAVITALLSTCAFGGWLLVDGLRNGMNLMQERLGADIMVVPEGYESEMEELLLRGEPSNFYLDISLADELIGQEGVAQVSPQYFVTSLSDACCDYLVQIIGIDPETDFTVYPWIGEEASALTEEAVLVGANVYATTGESLQFFGQDFFVAGKLEATATGFDNSVFMTIETAENMLERAREKGYLLTAEKGEKASSLLIKVAEGQEITQVAAGLKQNYEGIDVLVSGNIISSISDRLSGYTQNLLLIWLVLLVLAIAVLSQSFSGILNERRKEHAILLMLGSTRKKLAGMTLYETLFISLSGGLLGILLSAFIIFPFQSLISLRLNLPFVLSSPWIVILMALLVLALVSAIVVAAVLLSLRRVSRKDNYSVLREGW